ALIAVLSLLAFVYNNNLSYVLAFLLAGVFFVSMTHSYKSLAGLVVGKGRNVPAFAGEPADFTVNVSNPTAAPRISLLVGARNATARKIDIAPESAVRVTLRSKTGKRGWHELDTVTLESYFPLGLFRAWSPLRLGSRVLVYPKPAEYSMPFPEAASSSGRTGKQTDGSDDFFGFQEYRPGDSIRRIHWKAYAKQQGLYSKQYSGEKSSETWLTFEQTPGRNLEERLSRMCRWVVDAEQAGIRYGFDLPGTRLAPGRGLDHYRKCLESLALF
ncbi:MAG: DUF58 domain-containing protein, partial [Gammaproteobacteria bacterium]